MFLPTGRGIRLAFTCSRAQFYFVSTFYRFATKHLGDSSVQPPQIRAGCAIGVSDGSFTSSVTLALGMKRRRLVLRRFHVFWVFLDLAAVMFKFLHSGLLDISFGGS